MGGSWGSHRRFLGSGSWGIFDALVVGVEVVVCYTLLFHKDPAGELHNPEGPLHNLVELVVCRGPGLVGQATAHRAQLLLFFLLLAA